MAISSDEQRRLVFIEALARAPNFKEETNAARPTTAEHEHALCGARVFACLAWS